MGQPGFLRAADLSTAKIKIGFIGCGGRGTGAASQALQADSNVELWAMGDAFRDKIDTSLQSDRYPKWNRANTKTDLGAGRWVRVAVDEIGAGGLQEDSRRGDRGYPVIARQPREIIPASQLPFEPPASVVCTGGRQAKPPFDPNGDYGNIYG